jgi:hypothetical protein
VIDLTVVFGVISLVLFVLLIASIRYNVRFGRIIIDVQDAIEESLDVLDTQYNSISQILEKPIFFDSPEVRQTIENIGKSRDAILYVANILAGSVDEEAVVETDDKTGA